jgi:hypothetical protein
MFTPNADQDLITSIVDQMSVANPKMGNSAMYEIFNWNARYVPATLESTQTNSVI